MSIDPIHLTAPNLELAGKAALITGAARNMGRAFAVALAGRGADIVVHYHGPHARTDAEQTVQQVLRLGRRAVAIEGDLAQTSTARALVDAAMTTYGRLDIAINNAGLVIKKPVAEITEDDFDRCFAINAKAAFFLMKEAAARMGEGGRIINLGTTILGATIPFYSVYAGSKAPLEAFSRALAKEVGARGITVNTIAPGPIDTPFYHGAETEQSVARATQASVAGRLGRVDDIVPVVEFLASPRSQWITAQTIFVNGGYLAR
jgi:NAD(P)-dependent dehydrogenase (short-subunit alcohol dehydrogenase family)